MKQNSSIPGKRRQMKNVRNRNWQTNLPAEKPPVRVIRYLLEPANQLNPDADGDLHFDIHA
jgi:hypothetical protein